MSNKLALIVWAIGQDWKIITQLLKDKWYNIIWISSDKNFYHWINCDIEWTNILDVNSVDNLFELYKPNEIYYLAAYHHSSQDILPSDDILFQNSYDIHVLWYFNILGAVKKYCPNTNVVYASSCLIFEWTESYQQNENTQLKPESPYAITKAGWMYLSDWYNKKYWIKTVNAILYNHESEYRSPKFVSMKIVSAAVNISKWLQDRLEIWDINKQVDWWSAWDYCEAMIELIHNNKIWNYIISSGKLHTIKDIITLSFWYLDLNWKKYVDIGTNLSRDNKSTLFWDNSKMFKDIGWKPKIEFEEMVYKMIQSVLNLK